MPRPSSRELILDAYEDLLVRGGPAVVTLDAVARGAEVSKGGLLYHFGSKEALQDGLLRRLRERGELDLAAARAAPEGPVRYYLMTSVRDVETDSPLHRTFLAALRLMLDDARLAAAMREFTEHWQGLLSEETGDPLAAAMLTALGDGLYLQAFSGVDNRRLLAAMDEVVGRVTAAPRS